MDYMIRKINENLWKNFKSRCAYEGKTMLEVIIELITKYVSK